MRPPRQLSLRTDDLESRAISPFIEMGAYEALWDENGASFKSIAERFQDHEGAIPSDFVKVEVANDYAGKAVGILKKAGVTPFGVRVHGAGEYPLKLRDARYPIELLYFQGWWDLVESPCVSIVGTRSPTEEGKARAKKLAHWLVDKGYTIVSGLARGIDTVVHTTVINEGGKTIAVIGTPLSETYPRENTSLQKTISEQHLLISQVPIVRFSRHGPSFNRMFFPERNITMSALSEATIIVEAGETSGTLTQARDAFQQNRKLFILDSCFLDKSLTWPKKYVERGALRVRDVEDIERELGT